MVKEWLGEVVVDDLEKELVKEMNRFMQPVQNLNGHKN